MAEIKNTFIKAKMNKDLDDRLVPPGEYRNAQNIDEEIPVDLTMYVHEMIYFCSRTFYHLCDLMDSYCFFDFVSDLDRRRGLD